MAFLTLAAAQEERQQQQYVNTYCSLAFNTRFGVVDLPFAGADLRRNLHLQQQQKQQVQQLLLYTCCGMALSALYLTVRLRVYVLLYILRLCVLTIFIVPFGLLFVACVIGPLLIYDTCLSNFQNHRLQISCVCQIECEGA